MSRPWMPLYVGDYMRDTAHLSTLEHGAYLLLIMHYWSCGRLPDDERKIARIAKLSEREWAKVGPVIASLFSDGWRHKRVEQELAKAEQKSKSARASAMRSHSVRKANAKQSHSERAAEAVLPQPQIPSQGISILGSEPPPIKVESYSRGVGGRRHA